MSGMVSLPFCCWAFGRLARFRYPVPELFAFAGLCFVLNESYSIWGGNVKSTMAGEFSFSIALSVMMLGLGLLCRALDDGEYLIWAAGVLAVACLCHGIVLIYTVIGALVIVLCRCGADLWRSVQPPHRRATPPSRPPSSRAPGCSWLCTADRGCSAVGCSSAFWVGPFLFDHAYMTDMKYGFRPDSRIYRATRTGTCSSTRSWCSTSSSTSSRSFGGFLLAHRPPHVYGIALGLTTLAAVALTYLAHDSLPGIGLLWNPRVLPLVYLMRYLLMMVGAVEVAGVSSTCSATARLRAEVGVVASTGRLLVAGGLVVLVVFGWVFQVLPGAGYVTKGRAGLRLGAVRRPGRSEP